MHVRYRGKERGRKALKNKMDERIRSLYIKMIQEKRGTGKISRKTQEEINGLLEQWEQEDSQRKEEFPDIVFLAACAAEENGFVMGVKYAFRLFVECIWE